jgi:signal transduction histidine kinase
MSKLINGLLAFSLINQTGDNFEPTDLREVLKNIRNDFEVLIQQKGINLKIGDLPAIEAIPLQMNQLFFNLLGNALKFTVEGRESEVEISSRTLSVDEVAANEGLDTEQSYCEIMVRDNGIGFDQQYAEKVFEIFQRLNARTAYDGTGLGLAVCHKIVQNHDGIIYSRSKENEGASFFVILPFRHKTAALD